MYRRLFKNNIARAYSTSLLGVVSGLLTNLWLLREITREIPAGDFGIYLFVLQISGYLAIFQLGLDFAASRQIAESLGRKNFPQARQALFDLRRFNRHMMVLGTVAVVVLSGLFWCGVGFKDSQAAKMAGIIALLTGASQLVTFLARPYSAALIGSQCQATTNIITVLRTIFTSLLAFCFLKAGFYILCVPVAEMISQLMNWQVLHLFAIRKCEWMRSVREAEEQKSELGSLLKFGGLTTLGGVGWTIESTMDVVILGWMTNTQTVAAYVLWWRFPQMLFDFCSRLATSAFPGFSQRFGVSKEAIRMLFGKVAYVSMGLGTLACVGISLWLPSFIQLWIGIKYTGQQSDYLPMAMGILVCLRTGGNLLGMVWMASGRAELTAALSWIQALVKLGLALLLIPTLGILGAVVASCATSLLQAGVMGRYLFREHLLHADVIRGALLLGVLAVLASVAGRLCAFHVGWIGLLAGALATSVVWGGIWSVVAWGGELREPMQAAMGAAAKKFGFTKAA